MVLEKHARFDSPPNKKIFKKQSSCFNHRGQWWHQPPRKVVIVFTTPAGKSLHQINLSYSRLSSFQRRGKQSTCAVVAWYYLCYFHFACHSICILHLDAFCTIAHHALTFSLCHGIGHHACCGFFHGESIVHCSITLCMWQHIFLHVVAFCIEHGTGSEVLPQHWPLWQQGCFCSASEKVEEKNDFRSLCEMLRAMWVKPKKAFNQCPEVVGWPSRILILKLFVRKNNNQHVWHGQALQRHTPWVDCCFPPAHAYFPPKNCPGCSGLMVIGTQKLVGIDA